MVIAKSVIVSSSSRCQLRHDTRGRGIFDPPTLYGVHSSMRGIVPRRCYSCSSYSCSYYVLTLLLGPHECGARAHGATAYGILLQPPGREDGWGPHPRLVPS